MVKTEYVSATIVLVAFLWTSLICVCESSTFITQTLTHPGNNQSKNIAFYNYIVIFMNIIYVCGIIVFTYK